MLGFKGGARGELCEFEDRALGGAMETTCKEPSFVTTEQTNKGNGGSKVREGGREGREIQGPEIGSQCHLAHACDEIQVWVEPDASYYAIGMREVRR